MGKVSLSHIIKLAREASGHGCACTCVRLLSHNVASGLLCNLCEKVISIKIPSKATDKNRISSKHGINYYPETPVLCSAAVLVAAALLCVNTLSHPSPISDLSASIRARNASASLISPSVPSSIGASSGFVIGDSNTDVAARPRLVADRRDDTFTLIVPSDGK